MFEYLPELMKGLHTSLTLTVASLIVALILALIFTIILTLKTPVLVWLVRGYITLFTGTPLLVQIFLLRLKQFGVKLLNITFHVLYSVTKWMLQVLTS